MIPLLKNRHAIIPTDMTFNSLLTLKKIKLYHGFEAADELVRNF